jgi:hypothetical protein
MNLTNEQRAALEEELVDTLIAWKKKTDAMAGDMMAARAAMLKAKEVRIWEGKYGSFKEWLEQECGISRSWAYEIIGTAKTIEAIEDAAAEGLPEGKKEVLEQLRTTVRALPTRQLKKLKALKPLRAAEILVGDLVMERADENGKVFESSTIHLNDNVKSVEEQLHDRVNEVQSEPPEEDRRGEILGAVEAEWATLKRGMAYVPVTPEGVYLAIKRVLEKVL